MSQLDNTSETEYMGKKKDINRSMKFGDVLQPSQSDLTQTNSIS